MEHFKLASKWQEQVYVRSRVSKRFILFGLRSDCKNFFVLNFRLEKQLFTYQADIIKAVRGGWPGNEEQEQWDFDKAFLYSLTVITTIGNLFECFLYMFEKKMFFFSL